MGGRVAINRGVGVTDKWEKGDNLLGFMPTEGAQWSVVMHGAQSSDDYKIEGT